MSEKKVWTKPALKLIFVEKTAAGNMATGNDGNGEKVGMASDVPIS